MRVEDYVTCTYCGAIGGHYERCMLDLLQQLTKRIEALEMQVADLAAKGAAK